MHLPLQLRKRINSKFFNSFGLSIRAVSLLTALCLFAACKSGGRSGLAPGDQVPEISGVNLESAPVKLSDQHGKVILVNFWATWCGPCVSELPALERVYEQLKGEGLTVVGVAINDTLEEVKEYRQKYGLTFPIILDEQGISKKDFELKGVPESFILDGERRVLMLPDPATSEPMTRIVGAREWDGPQSVAALKASLGK